MSDKFYLKNGGLELSMLEDEDETPKGTSLPKVEVPKLQHTKRRREMKSPEQPKLKVTSEIYNTLQAMSQYLTRSEDKPVNAAKAQLIEQVASTIKVKMPYSEVDKEVEASYKRVQTMGCDQVAKQEERETEGVALPSFQELEELKTEEDIQREVDVLVSQFFTKKAPDYSFTRDLKKHIDKQIEALNAEK